MTRSPIWLPRHGLEYAEPQAHRRITYSADMCPRTLEILARICHVSVPYNLPMADVRTLGRRLLGRRA